MHRLISSILLCSLGAAVLSEVTTETPLLLKALATKENSHSRPKRQCGAGGCGGGCRGGGFGCGNGGGGCRGINCGGGCHGNRCFNNNFNSCTRPCGNGGRLCCDSVAPRPCVGCGLNRGIFPEPVPVAVGVGSCCACCMPLCVPRCINFGCGSCGGFGGGFGGGYGFGGYDYFDYLG